MPQRGYVLIFFFWALLAIITPTLVFWSASAKAGLLAQGEDGGRKATRRMMDCAKKVSPLPDREELIDPAATPAPAPAPAPAERHRLMRKLTW